MKQYLADKVRISPAIMEGLTHLGISTQELAQMSRLPAAILLDKVPANTEQFFAFWNSADALYQGGNLGIALASAMEMTTLPPPLFSCYVADNLASALQRLQRFKRLTAPERIHITQTDSGCTLSLDWVYATTGQPNALVDLTFATLVSLARSATRQTIRPTRIGLRRKKGQDSALKEFFNCDIRYGVKDDVISFATEDLTRPFLTRNSAVSAMLLPQLTREVDLASNQLTDQVRQIIQLQLGAGSPKIEAVAAELGMGHRTLQRRIEQEGFTFKRLLAEERSKTAKRYLSDPELGLCEVAALVGYEDQNSFLRAFKQWEGETPSRWRQKQCGQHL